MIETRKCQNCHQSFQIVDDDFKFYEKISVPTPTFCPKCRLQRRLASLNLFNLYERPCDLCGKNPISIFTPDAPYKVYCPSCWWSDNWSWEDYGRDYDFTRPFFEQYAEMWHEVPILGLSLDLSSAKESPYNNHAGYLKNCYLLFHANHSENTAYGFHIDHVTDSLDSSLIISCELCYDSMHSYKDNRCVGNRNQVANCIDCVFVRYAFNCQNCFASTNIRNKKYYIFNRPYTKEEYFKEISKWDLGSYKTYKEVQKRAEEHWKKFPPKPKQDDMSINCSGSHVLQSKNCHECYEAYGVEDSKFLHMMLNPPVKDCYDITSWGENLTLSYEGCIIGENSSGMKFCQEAGINLYDAEYCKLSTGGSNHFGCISVKKGDYVIFNKRYTKEEYEKLRVKIIKHMDEMPYVDKRERVYKYGEFFPAEISPFTYNETVANNFFPMSMEEILENGYKYREPEIKKHDTTMKSESLPDHIKDTPGSILNEVIECKCGRGFRIIQMELNFLRERNLPLPRECPFCRIQEKYNQWIKNLRLIPRICEKCGANFETEFTKEEAPVIYCKKCWQAEYI